MKQNGKVAYTPEFVESLKDGQVFVFGSNLIGNHSGGASLVAMQRFGAVWGQAEGPQGQCYAIPVDIRGEAVENVSAYMKLHIDKFLVYAKAHPELFFMVIRVGCGNAGFDDEFVAPFFKEALEVKNICLPKSFVDALKGGEVVYDLDRFVKAQDSEIYTYADALNEIKEGHKQGHWIWYVFPQIKGLGHSNRSEYYGIASKEEASTYLEHPILGKRLRDITQTFLDCTNPSAFNILGFPDVLKVQSCMTLFDLVSPNDIFHNVLDKYYEGKRCEKTMRRLGGRDEKAKNVVKMSRLTISKDCTIQLADYKKEVKMEPIVKAVYLLFLKHPEGIAFKYLPDYRKELADIYQKIKPFGLTERAIRSIEDVTNPLLNSINEKCSRVRAAFQSEVDPTLLEQYIIVGKSGEAKKVMLSRDLVVWE